MEVFRVLEAQVTDVKHPMQLLARQFRAAFLRQYEQYVVPSQLSEEDVEARQQKLIDNIIQKTVNLQSEYVFKMEAQLG